MEEMEGNSKDLAAEVVPEVGWRWRGTTAQVLWFSLPQFHWWYWRHSRFWGRCGPQEQLPLLDMVVVVVVDGTFKVDRWKWPE
jgi:hypothetical protein